MRTFGGIGLILVGWLLGHGLAQADVLHLKDGRKLEGEVREEGDNVKIKTVGGEFSFPREQVDKVVRSKSKEQLYEEKRAKLKDDDALGHYALAVWCKLEKMQQQMDEHLRKVIEIDPDHELARKALGYRLVNGKWLTEAEAKQTAKAAASGQVAEVEPRGRKPAGAVPDAKVQEIVDSVPEKRQTDKPAAKPDMRPAPVAMDAATRKAGELSQQALKAFQEKRYGDAVSLYTECLKLCPEEANFYYSRAYVYYALRRTEEALADINKSLELRPGNATALFSRALVHVEMGNIKEAVTDLEAVQKLDPANLYAKQRLPALRLVYQGPKWRQKFTRSTPHYVVSTDVDQKLADKAAAEMERIYKEYAAKFRFKGDEQKRRFNVRIFSSKEGFSEYSSQTTGQIHEKSLGYYTPTYKELVLWHESDMESLIDVLYHEGFHQFLDYFIADAPVWFNEGLAQYFETAKWTGDGFKIGRSNPNKLEFLQRMIEARAYVPFKKLLRMTHPEFMSQDPAPIEGATMVNVHYTQSWAFVHFLIHANDGKYKWVIRDFYQALKAGKKPDEAFEEVFGAAKFARIEEAWTDYARDLKY
jgi:tetratricopeptide (TPR) repeat protein